MYTRLTLRNRIATDSRETQINTTIEDYINLTLQEIQSPAWAFEQAGLKGFDHKWSFNRRKTTLTTSNSIENYQLPRDLDDIGLIRQTTSPNKINFIPDDLFYEWLPNPTALGNPKYYRIWEQEGVEVRLSAADTLEVISSSASDTTQTVRIVGKDANGLVLTESLTLTGTTVVAGTITYASGSVLRVSKSADTVGIITIRKATADVTLVKLAPTETSARFKVISFYPIPATAITIYLEYFTHIRRLEGDNDVPDLAEKWMWLVRTGAMAKVYQYQNKEALFNTTQALFAAGLRSMVKEDMQNVDYIPVMRSQLEGVKEFYSLTAVPYNYSIVARATFSDADLVAGILTITHNKGLTAPYSLLVEIIKNTGEKISPDDITYATNTVAVDLTSWIGSITDWGYILIG
jgi:hypothetical protein